MKTARIVGRCDGGIDDKLTSPKVADQALSKGIGVMDRILLIKLSVALRKGGRILPIKLSVALRKGEKTQKFTFCRSWTEPRSVFQLAAGSLALTTVQYVVAHDDLNCAVYSSAAQYWNTARWTLAHSSKRTDLTWTEPIVRTSEILLLIRNQVW